MYINPLFLLFTASILNASEEIKHFTFNPVCDRIEVLYEENLIEIEGDSNLVQISVNNPITFITNIEKLKKIINKYKPEFTKFKINIYHNKNALTSHLPNEFIINSEKVIINHFLSGPLLLSKNPIT